MELAYPFMGVLPTSILRDRSVMGHRQMRQRRSHGFIIKLAGATEYRTGEGAWLLSAGEVLFVEKGACYEIREVTPGYSYVVNFECHGLPDGLMKLPLPKGFDLQGPADRLFNSWQRGERYQALAALYGILEVSAGTQRRAQYAAPGERQLLAPVVDWLQAHLTDPELQLGELSHLAGISDAYLRRVFKKQYGVGPSGYVIRERIRLAKRLLESGGKPVALVAARVGYRDPLYFSRLFKKQTGLSPTEYSRRHGEELF